MNNDDTKYILTIDMGTTAFKAAVFDCDGREAGSATEEYQIQTPRPGWAEMDAEKYTELFKAAVSGAVKNAGISREDILTLGISCQGETSVFLDSDSRPLRPAIIWCDTRALQEAKEIVDAFGSTTIQHHTGQVGCDALWPGAKLIWIRKNEPEIFRNIAHILQLNGYFAYLLTGKMAEDDSMLGSSIYWNIRMRQYWDEMLEYIGITKAQLPQIVRSAFSSALPKHSTFVTENVPSVSVPVLSKAIAFTLPRASIEFPPLKRIPSFDEAPIPEK